MPICRAIWAVPGYHPTGIGELRAAVADQYTARGLPTSPEQIMITNGVLHALDLVLRLLVPVGAHVLVESPTYPNALAALAGRRARVSTHGMDEAGWDADLLLGSLRQTRPRLAYLIPEFQNPTGHLMPAPLREQLVATAQRAGTDLVIDESFVDLPLDGQPMPPAVASFDRHGRVLTIGGMSKPFWGGLRIGWVRASAPTVQRLAAARVGVDTAGPVLDQLVGVHLLAMADKVIADRRRQLGAQRDALLAAVGEHLPAWRITRPSGGVTLWAELDGPVSSALARAVESHGRAASRPAPVSASTAPWNASCACLSPSRSRSSSTACAASPPPATTSTAPAPVHNGANPSSSPSPVRTLVGSDVTIDAMGSRIGEIATAATPRRQRHSVRRLGVQGHQSR